MKAIIVIPEHNGIPTNLEYMPNSFVMYGKLVNKQNTEEYKDVLFCQVFKKNAKSFNLLVLKPERHTIFDGKRIQVYSPLKYDKDKWILTCNWRDIEKVFIPYSDGMAPYL